ncbi:MAG: PKD domain-containing protein [Bacteroidota bacterium]
MKTLKTLSVLSFLMCCSFFSNAQFICGVDAAFTQNVNPNNVVSFYDTSHVAPGTQIALWRWDFGDGIIDTSQNPTHVYTSPGTYRVCLYVSAMTMGATCADSICKTLTIGSPGCGNANASFNILASGTSVLLASNSTGVGPGTLYQWWMDGNAVNNPTNSNSSFTLNNVSSGNHSFCLYIYANNVNTFCDSTCRIEHIGPNCNRTATITDSLHQNGAHSLRAGFSNNNIFSYLWSNGATSSAITVTAPGVYCVTVTDFTACTASVCHTITNNHPCAGITSAWGSASLGGDSIVFEAADTNLLANHYWNFGDGSSGSGTRIVHHYAAPGTYNVCFYVYIPGINCVDSSCRTITVPNGNPCSTLNADWTQSFVSGGAVHFISLNNNFNVSSHWTFGDGTPGSNLFDPTHCYSAGGLYNVCHIVNIPGTICADTNCHQIQAQACNPCTGFAVNIGWGPNSMLGGFNVEANLAGLPPTTPTTFVWSTGDTGRVIRVAQPGIYCVTATNANGCSATACDSVGGNNTCHIAVTIIPQSSGGVYVLTAQASGGTAPYTFSWDNGISFSNVITVTAPGTYCVIVHDGNQCVGDACFTVPGFTGTDTICGTVFEDTNGNGVMDSSESGIPGALIYIGNHSVHADSFGLYFAIVPSGNYSIIYCARPGFSYTVPVSLNNNGINCAGYYQVQISGGGMHCGFNFGVQNNSVSICGKVYLDANNNQTQDIGENGIPNVHVYVTGTNGHTYHAYTDANGQYCVLVPVGTYTIHATSNTFNTCPVTPQSLTVLATVAGQQFNGNDFAAYCQPGLCNLRVSVTPHTTVTAGFRAWYSIQVCNVGSSISGGMLNMFYDPALTFDYASPVQTSHNASTHTVSWNVNNMLPGNCRYFWAYFDANTNITIGQSVFTLVNITPDTSCNDVNMVNNVDTIHQHATASWDPNNKFAYVTNTEIDERYQWVSSMNADQRMEYVINFQNLGNAPAVNVVVKDVVSSDLDLNTFELLGTSHPAVVTEDAGELNFKFSNIMLAAKSIDEPNSHGWIKFAINSVNGLAGGHIITDEADIYFDYNLPVTTNDAAVIMLDATGIDEVSVNNVTVVIAPNPMSQFAEIRLDNPKADYFRLRVADLTGRLVADKVSSGNTMMFQRDALAAGLYTYQIIQNEKVVAKGKLVAE